MHLMKPLMLALPVAAFSLFGAGVADSEATPPSQKTGKAKATRMAGRVECSIGRALAGLRGVSEASGIAPSRRTLGILWTHGDSYEGEPFLFAFDARGIVRGRVRLKGVRVVDWEDIAVGPCGASSCVFVGDIGDNEARRKSITIYRFSEPLPTVPAAPPGEAFHAVFPDGAQDAESMFVSSAGEMFVVTKGETGPIALYRFGPSPKSGAITVLQRVVVLQKGRIAKDQWVTGASASPDGKWVALRTHGAVSFYEAERLLRGDASAPLKFDARPLKEPQGEGIGLGAKGAVFLSGESGRKGVPGTLSSGVCKLPERARVRAP